MKYEVGQVVFLLDNGEMKIFPARIEEEIVRRKVGSEDVTYKIALPNRERTVVDLSDLDVTVFTSPSELRSHMAENALRTIDGLIERAAKVASALRHPTASSSDDIDPVQSEEDVV
jgi:hypothetical protein